MTKPVVVTDSPTLDLEAEISAAKVRLGYGPHDPAPGALVVLELPQELHRAFWARQMDRWLATLETDAEIGPAPAEERA